MSATFSGDLLSIPLRQPAVPWAERKEPSSPSSSFLFPFSDSPPPPPPPSSPFLRGPPVPLHWRHCHGNKSHSEERRPKQAETKWGDSPTSTQKNLRILEQFFKMKLVNGRQVAFLFLAFLIGESFVPSRRGNCRRDNSPLFSPSRVYRVAFSPSSRGPVFWGKGEGENNEIETKRKEIPTRISTLGRGQRSTWSVGRSNPTFPSLFFRISVPPPLLLLL